MHFLIDNKLNIIFGFSPKCGCTSIKTIFMKNTTNIELKNNFYQMIKNKESIHFFGTNNCLPNDLTNFNIVLFIRNPYKRLVSGFLDKYKKNGELINLWKKKDILTFNNFINTIINEGYNKNIEYHHFTPQTTHFWEDRLLNHNKVKVMDIENIDYNYLSELFKKEIKPERVHINKIKRKDIISAYNININNFIDFIPNYNNFYNYELYNKVYMIYKKDFLVFEKYGYKYHNTNIRVLITNSEFRKIDYIIIEQLKKKNIIIDLEKNNINYDFVFSNIKDFFKIFKIILKNKSLQFKLNVLNKLFKNMDCVILGGGPSAIKLTNKELFYLKNNYFLFVVKYMIETLYNINISADFNILNASISGNKNIHYYTNLAKDTFIFASMRGLKPKNYIDINFTLYNNSLPHHITFNEINKGNISVLNYKIINNHLCYNFSHIMLEIVIPMCMFMGFKNIYTFGWDLKGSTILNTLEYKSDTNINHLGEPKEIVCLESLNKILKKLEITIYKCSNYSIIPFEYINILNNI